MTFDYNRLPEFELVDEPSAWEVQGLGGAVLVIYASSRSVEGDKLQYDLLLAGRPPVLLPIAWGSPALFEQSYTELASDRPANDFDWATATGTRFVAPPDRWNVQLTDGHRLEVYANDADERNGEHIFVLTVASGGPPLPVARLSSQLVLQVRRTPADAAASPRHSQGGA